MASELPTFTPDELSRAKVLIDKIVARFARRPRYRDALREQTWSELLFPPPRTRRPESLEDAVKLAETRAANKIRRERKLEQSHDFWADEEPE